MVDQEFSSEEEKCCVIVWNVIIEKLQYKPEQMRLRYSKNSIHVKGLTSSLSFENPNI